MVEEYIWSRYQQEEVKFCEDLGLQETKVYPVAGQIWI